MESFVDDGVLDTPGMNREPSYTVQAACDFQVTREMARSAINMCNGDVNEALIRLLTTKMASPTDDLCQFGGIDKSAAENYLLRAGNDLDKAKQYILEDIIILGSASNGDIQKVQCPCCLDVYKYCETVTVSACDHVFCIDCMKGWIEAEASTSSTGVVRCPRGRECNETLSQQELQILLSPGEYSKLDRRLLETAVQTDKTLRMCSTPDCSYIVSWAIDDGPPMLHCPLCHVQRCLACGVSPYHVGMTCDEAALVRDRNVTSIRNAEEEEATRRYMESSGIRVCKKCGNGVEMSSGCLKMKCRCGYRFCFKCGSENAQCGCTPANHGFWDNIVQRGDFRNLK